MVVIRKTAVQPGIRRARHRPIVTTTPQAMAMRLIATCSRVKAPVDIPRIMGATMRLSPKSWAIAGQASAWAIRRIAPQQHVPRAKWPPQPGCFAAVRMLRHSPDAPPQSGQDARAIAWRQHHFLNEPGGRSRLAHAFG